MAATQTSERPLRPLPQQVGRPTKTNVYAADAISLGGLAQPTLDAGSRLFDAAATVHRAIDGLDWEGRGRNAAEVRADRELDQDRKTTAGYEALADACVSGSRRMQPMIDSLRRTGQAMEADHFDVSQHWAVTDTFDYQAGKAAMMHFGASDEVATDRMRRLAAERGQEAAEATSTLQRLADQLADADHDTARAITAATTQILDTRRRPRIQTVDHHTFKQDPAPKPFDPKDMSAEQARAAWAGITAEIAQYNARCGRTFILPNEQGAFDACNTDRGLLVERQAAIRERLGQLGIPVADEGPVPPTGPSQPGGRASDPPQNVRDTLDQIDAGKWPGAAKAPGTRGGSVFENNPQPGQTPALPIRDSSGNPITYQEWDVNPRAPGQDRDLERIVTGSDGSAWYTTDHYHTFHRIR